MQSTVSFCGLICVGCPIYWATHEKNEDLKHKMREEIAKMSNELYKTDFNSDNITDCDGCLPANRRLFAGCVNCQIRNCAKEKNLQNCAYCIEYICDTLDKFFKDNPDSKIRLDFIRSII